MEFRNIDRRRRWFGALFLILAGGQVVWGQTLLKEFLEQRPFYFLFYWLLCFLFTTSAMVVALLDLWVTKIRARHDQGQLNQTLLQGKRGRALNPRERKLEDRNQETPKYPPTPDSRDPENH